MGLHVIGGELRGKRLFSARGRSIRPTGSRQREAIFNILAREIESAEVLDLFAGTGALGIEALSRGAGFSVFVDNHFTALDTLKRNICTCRLEGKTRIFRWNLRNRMDFLKTAAAAFDIVFMDPPYNQNHIGRTLDNLRQCACLNTGAVVVVEHSLEESIPKSDAAYTLSDQRRYGKTLVSFLSYVV